jgi:hypothetical protein
MRIGASCVCKSKKDFEGKVTSECASAEIRHTGLYPEVFKRNVEFCLENNIYIIVNIMLRKGEEKDKFYNEQEWRRHVDGIVVGMLTKEPSATKWRITIANEPMKYVTKEKYASYINIACDQVKKARGYKHVKIGAGNEEFSKAAESGMYEHILKNCSLLDYLDIHIQAAVINPATMRVMDGSLDYYGNVAKAWAKKYNLKLACPEANWCNVAKKEGYTDLIKIYNKALEIGCEDFDVVFIDYSGKNEYKWLCFNVDGKNRTKKVDNKGNIIYDNWSNFKKLMKKDDLIKPIKGGEDMFLERLYYKGRPSKLIKVDQKGYGIRVLRAYFNLFDANEFDDALDAKVREFQIANNLLVDGKVGSDTFTELMITERWSRAFSLIYTKYLQGVYND